MAVHVGRWNNLVRAVLLGIDGVFSIDKTADSACSPISEAMLIWGGQINFNSLIFLKDHCQPSSKMVIVEALFWFIFIIGLIHVLLLRLSVLIRIYHPESKMLLQ